MTHEITTQWRTIDSAPKDGSKILLWAWGKVAIGEWDMQPHHSQPRPYWTYDNRPVTTCRGHPPTHWRPLPPPPRENDDE